MRRNFWFVLILFALICSPARAWGELGHLAVCDLAYRNLTQPAREELKRLFNAPAGIDVRGRHYTSFNAGCLEQDAFPRPRPADHFINVSRDTPAIEGVGCPAGALSCIILGIENDVAVLKDFSRSDADRVYALLALGHWVGDIHQPLHVSFGDDKGGNEIRARVAGGCGASNDDPRNLHAVWDGCMLQAGLFERVRRRADYSTSWAERTITYRAVDTLQANSSWSEEKRVVLSDPWQWANESYQIAVLPDVRYCIRVGDNCQYLSDQLAFEQGGTRRSEQLAQDYLDQFDRVAERRIQFAGLRLAHLINQALDPAYVEPLRNTMQRP